MRSVKHAKHAKPALHPTRTTLSTGLTAVLLPLCMAAPALADGEPTASPTTVSSTAPTEPAAAEPSTSATPTATTSATPAASPTAAASPAPAPKASSVVRISGPRGTVAPGPHALGVRLEADGAPVKDGYVRVEKMTSSGWAYAGRLLTRSDGLGVGRFSVTRTTRFRAIYQGSSTRTAATSSEIRVTVAAAASDFRARALKVVAAQRGKPYRYGSTGPSSFDCSGLMVYTFKQVGKRLPRTSQQQLNATQRISKSAKRPGDLIFTHRGGRVGHVGVYAGNGNFWVAPRTGSVVKLQRIYTSSYYVGRVN